MNLIEIKEQVKWLESKDNLRNKNFVGLKDDKDKINWSLLPYNVLKEVAQIYTEGAKKYKAHNWKKVENARDRYFSALMRHLIAWKEGEIINNTDFGLSHMGHVIWNAMALSYFDMENKI